MKQHLAVTTALMIGWSAEAWALCAVPPGLDASQEVYDGWAAQVAGSKAVLIDAVVEQPEGRHSNPDVLGSISILRATRVWKGPAQTHFRVEHVVSSTAGPGFKTAGERVRVVLYPTGEQGLYSASGCTQAFLDHPRMIEALARRLNQPELKPRSVRDSAGR